MLRVVTSGPEHLEAEKSLTEMMAAADLVLLGMRSDDVRDLHGLLGSRDELLTRLPPTLLVPSNGEADLLA